MPLGDALSTTPEVSAIRDADRIVGLLEANEMKAH